MRRMERREKSVLDVAMGNANRMGLPRWARLEGYTAARQAF